MLFLIHRPTNLLISNHNKIILTTQQQIIFTSLHFLEEFVSRELVQPHPEMLQFSEQPSEAVVASRDAIQIYWTDWHCKIQLRLFVALSQEPIYSIAWEGSWKVFGDFKQYSPSKIKLVRTQSYDDDFSSCFLGELQFILTNKRLVSYNHRTKRMNDIEWVEREEQIARLKDDQIEMKVVRVPSGEVVLSLSNLCVFVRGQKVQSAFHHQGKLFVNEEVALWIDHGKNMVIYHINKGGMVKLGEIQVFQGHYLGCTLAEERLAMLFYDFKELQVKYIKLVDVEEDTQWEHIKQEKERLKFALRSSLEERGTSESNLYNLNPSTSPQESKNNIHQSLVGNNIQLALKASIQKFQEQLHKSFDTQRYNGQMQMQSDILHMEDEIRASKSPKASEQNSQDKEQELQSLGIVTEQQLNECQNLFEHGESGFQWQQMESNYEQRLESSDIVNELHPFENEILQFDFAETPAFNQLNNHWAYNQNEWNFIEGKDPIEEVESSRTISAEKKSQIVEREREVDKRKQTQILSELFRREPEKFDEALEESVLKVIQENEARIFFADHIRIHNPDLTRDRLLRLYRRIDDTDQNRRLMARALSEFRLEQVPLSILPIKREVLSIFQKIYPAVYIQDILLPTLMLYEEFIQSYFSKKFTFQTLEIEDESIELTHPRNLLNIVLYLNDYFQIPMESIFEVYIKKMIRHNQVGTLKRIVEGTVCEICGISKEVFEKCAESTAKEILEEDGGMKQQLIEEVMLIMNPKMRKLFVEVLSLIGYFNQFRVVMKINSLFDLPRLKNSESVLRQIIGQNSPQVISKLSLPFIFRSLGKIESDRTPLYYTPWHISITKYTAQILMAAKYEKDAVSNIFPLVPILKRGFIAKILIKYMDGKYANRLVCPKESPIDIINGIFITILESSREDLQGDALPEDTDGEQWRQFHALCIEQLSYKCWELAYIMYRDKYLSKELINQEVILQSSFDELASRFPRRRKSTHISFVEINTEEVRIPLLFDAESHKSNESVEFNQSYSPKSEGPRPLLQQSFKGHDAVKEDCRQELGRSLRRHKDNQIDPALILLKIEVEKSSILAMLKQIYQEFPRDKFLAAVNMVDRQKVQLYHIEIYKSLAQTEFSFPFEKFIPFEYFLGQDELAWSKIHLSVKSELTHSNFWTIYLLIELLYHKENEVAFSFIERVIFYEMNDQWAQPIRSMLEGIDLTIDQLVELRSSAEQNNLQMVREVLHEKIVQLE